jgi:hypothetical protein
VSRVYAVRAVLGLALAVVALVSLAGRAFAADPGPVAPTLVIDGTELLVNATGGAGYCSESYRTSPGTARLLGGPSALTQWFTINPDGSGSTYSPFAVGTLPEGAYNVSVRCGRESPSPYFTDYGANATVCIEDGLWTLTCAVPPTTVTATATATETFTPPPPDCDYSPVPFATATAVPVGDCAAVLAHATAQQTRRSADVLTLSAAVVLFVLGLGSMAFPLGRS